MILSVIAELLQQVADALARIEAQQVRTNELLTTIDKTQWS
jgi:hypothetical protein